MSSYSFFSNDNETSMEQNGEDSLASTSNVNIDENQADESLAEESQDALHLTTDAENTEAENTEAENTENDESRDALGTYHFT